jgi:hypothetical protein
MNLEELDIFAFGKEGLEYAIFFFLFVLAYLRVSTGPVPSPLPKTLLLPKGLKSGGCVQSSINFDILLAGKQFSPSSQRASSGLQHRMSLLQTPLSISLFWHLGMWQ